MKHVGFVWLVVASGCIQQPPPSYMGPQNAQAPSTSGGGPVVSGDGRDEIVMPDVTNRSLADATAILRQAGVTGELHVQNEDPKPTVCGTTPGGGQRTLGHLSVSITLCDTSPRTGDPDLRGITVEAATAILRDHGFTGNITVGTVDRFDPGCKPKTVCDYSPTTWSARYGYGGDVTLLLNKP